MAVAEIETEGVVSDLLPAGHADALEVARTMAAVLLTENVPFALRLRTRRGGAQPGKGQEAFAAVVPDDGDFLSDELDVGR